ncbi:hypothetical protein [Paenibacillus sp. NEAU-GSW1]|uniref:hypothetical protein n=1 Tax=Paenibacillus sp. NEAU-GSW1 TaxID=2682486 RepID=UPI0012E18DBD|nr:hypothetical protein [Paenibacillus sp. NEAU-GSW1]MUT65131.1 hypothetical protein [Paenibacillus sp. NEAU-GSW1]
MGSFSIKHPLHMKTAIGFFTTIILLVYMIVKEFTSEGFTALFYCQSILLAVSMTLLIYLLLKSFGKASNVRFSDKALAIRGKELGAEKIEYIMVEGYFSPVVGIMPKGKRIVPVDHSFRFDGSGDEAIKALGAWAEKHKIKVYNKPFWRWI